MEVLQGSTPDISPLMQFRFWEPVYYMQEDAGFPSESSERKGRFVGISETVGDALTYQILTDDTNKVIHRSAVRTALHLDNLNRRLDPLLGEKSLRPVEVVKLGTVSTRARAKGEPELDKTGLQTRKISPGFTIDPDDIIGKIYLRPRRKDRQRFKA